MILRSLKLENIRSYQNEKIEFKEGSQLLTGDIGSGKSTILLAIEFSLFGIMRGELSGSSLLRHGKTQGNVELRFEIGKDEYVIKRTLKKSREAIVQDNGYILTNGRKFEGTPVELKAKIIGIIGYPEATVSSGKSLIYRYTVYTPQEEMKEILFDDKDMRLDTLRKLFGIGKYKAIKENAVIFIREIRRKSQEISAKIEVYSDIEKEKTEKEKRKEELISLISTLKKEDETAALHAKKEKEAILTVEKEMKRYNELKKSLDVSLAHLNGRKNSEDDLSKRIEEKKKHIILLEKKLQDYEKITGMSEEKVFEADILKEQDKLSSLVKDKSILASKIKSSDEQIKNIEEDIKDLSRYSKESILLSQKITQAEESLDKKKEQEELLSELNEKENKVLLTLERNNLQDEEAHKIIHTIEKIDRCPTCEQEITHEYKKNLSIKEKEKISNYKAENAKLSDFLKKINDSKEKVKKNLEKLSLLEKTNMRDREHLAKIEESLKTIVKRQKELSLLFEKKKEFEVQLEKKKENDEDKLKEMIEKNRMTLSAARENNLRFREKKNIAELLLEETKHIETIKKNLEKITSDIKEMADNKDDIEKEIEKCIKIPEEYENLKTLLDSALEQKKNIEIRLAETEKENRLLTETISELQKKIVQVGKLKENLKELSEIERWFDEFFLNLITTMEKHIMISIHREFSTLLKDWFSILTVDLDISLDDEFSPVIIQDGYETSIESLSGGEKTSIALAYRLALNKVVNDLIPEIKTKDLIILDEPTDGFSSEQLDKVRDLLNELGMKQTIIVSHEPKMESYVEHVIRVTKNNSESKIIY
jgi:exonuclease SbcC